jgi:hypothetical protein
MGMEKSQINNEIKKGYIPQPKLKKSLKLPTWIKAAALSIGIASSSPGFSQNIEGSENNNKKDSEIELMKEVSSYYHQESLNKEKSLNYIDYLGLSPEDKTKFLQETNNEIIYDEEISNNPEKLYKKILEQYEDCKAELIAHFCSLEFLEKLESTYSKEEAKSKQNEIVDNLRSVKVIITSPDLIKSKSNSGTAAASYSQSEHRILIPFAGFDKEIISHELLHSAYRADKELNDEEKKVLYKLFKNDKNRDKDENIYQHKSSERIVRKKLIDFELESLGVKKYGEKFTKEHFKILQDLNERHQLGGAAQDMLDTITEKQLIELMNTIAFQDNDKVNPDEFLKSNLT